MQNKAHVSLILDKSGSMSSVREKTISGVNEYFQTLKNDSNTDYTVDVVLFDTAVKNLYKNTPLSEVKPLTQEDYVPNDGTALYDAACSTITSREGTIDSKWIVVIMTDGEENSSKQYTEQQFGDYVKLCKAIGNVQFVFLGANQDAFAKAQKWNIPKGNVADFNSTPTGVHHAFYAASAATTRSANLDWATATANQAGSADTFFSKDEQQQLKETK